MRENELRMIAVDMDGTCIGKGQRVPERNLWALEQAHRAGVLVVPATGRALRGYPPEVKRSPGVRYVISSNGARLSDERTGETIREVLIPCGGTVRFLRRLRGKAVWISVHMDGLCIDNNLIPWLYRKLLCHGQFREGRYVPGLARRLAALAGRNTPQTGGPRENAVSRGVEKIQVFFLTSGARRKVLELVKRERRLLSCAMTHDRYVELTAHGASKGEALEALCRHLAIPAEAVMAIGDSENDLTMLRFAGRPVAMGNADPEVKAVVREAGGEITASYARCGVAQAVMRALRGKTGSCP